MTAANGPILIEIVFVIVGALGFGLWQLRSVNREIARDKEKARGTKGDGNGDG